MKKKIAWTGFVMYLLIMASGMYYAHAFRGYQYTQAEIMYGIWPFIFVLLILSFYLSLRYFKETEKWISELDKKQLLWFVPHMLLLFWIMAVILMQMDFLEFDTATKNLIFTTLFTTLMVGIAEEIMFRGIILHSLLEYQKPLIAVLLSALAFALLHSVNMLAGLGFAEMLGQLFSTFFFGLFFSLLMLKMKNIIILMAFHWLWDFSIFTLQIIGYETSLIILVPLLSILMSALLLKPIRKPIKVQFF